MNKKEFKDLVKKAKIETRDRFGKAILGNGIINASQIEKADWEKFDGKKVMVIARVSFNRETLKETKHITYLTSMFSSEGSGKDWWDALENCRALRIEIVKRAYYPEQNNN